MNVQPDYKDNKTKKENFKLSPKRTFKKEEKNEYGEWAELLTEFPFFILKGLWYIVELLGHIIWLFIRGIGHALHHIFDIFN